MEEEGENELLQEVEALRAIYLDENISFHPRMASSAATITISLEGLTNQKNNLLTLTTKLPSTYPTAHPQKPVLRADSFTTSQCGRLVDEMMRKTPVTEGCVCLFEWIQGMIAVINDHEITIPSDNALEQGEGEGEVEEGARKSFQIFHGEPLTDRKSVFQAHLAVIQEASEVDEVLTLLRSMNKKVESATHNMLAYRVVSGNGVVQDVDDDGEKGAGKVVLFVLQRSEVVNVVCVVSRWFGGIKLGPVRFRHISTVVGDAVERFKGQLEVEGD